MDLDEEHNDDDGEEVDDEDGDGDAGIDWGAMDDRIRMVGISGVQFICSRRPLSLRKSEHPLRAAS